MTSFKKAKVIRIIAAFLTATALLCCSCSKEVSDNSVTPTVSEPDAAPTNTPTETPTEVPAETPTEAPTEAPTKTPADASDDTPDVTPAGTDIQDQTSEPDDLYVFTPVEGVFSELSEVISNFEVTSAKGPVSYIYVMNWTDNSKDEPKDYEFCLTGLLSRPSEDKLVEMINSFTAGQKYIYTEDAEIIDTEKQYGISFSELGYPVSNHELFERANLYEPLGDSLLCWAASTANMLINSGWAYKAVNPNTGDYFKDTDEVFDYFMESFTNGGNDQKNGFNWFVAGKFERENASDADCMTETKGLLPEYYSEDGVLWDSIEEEDDVTLMSALLTGCEKLKEGYSLGTNIWLYSLDSYLDGEPDYSLGYDLVRGEYYQSDMFRETEVDYDSIGDYYMTYVYDENHRRVPVTSEAPYTDAEGNVYEECDVYENYLLYDEEQGNYNPLVLGNTGYVSEHREYIDASRVSFGGELNYSSGHAMTCMGYIINKNADDDFRKIEALVIVNSDDDDNELYPFREENSREFRPDKYTLYPTHISDNCASADGERLVILEDFKDNNEVYVYQIFSMKPFEE